MNTDSLPNTAKNVFIDIMKTFTAMQVTDPTADLHNPGNGPVFRASQAFTLCGNGRVIIDLPEGAARLMASRILCTDDPDSVESDMVNDAVKELLNIFVGNLLPLMPDAGPEAQLGLPELEILPSGTDILADREDANSQVLAVDSWPIRISIECQ